jgi:hypothetical protein
MVIAVLLLTEHGGPNAANAANAASCRQGTWDLSSYNNALDGSELTVRATSTRYCLFDGSLEMDEYRSFGPAGGLAFAGVSFHDWSPDGKLARTLWLMVGDSGYAAITGRMSNGDTLLSRGEGHDGQGVFVERSVTTTSRGRDYLFVMSRSYDAGATWIEPFNRITATYRGDSVPPLPTTLRPPWQEARTWAPDHPAGTVILDGLGEIHTRTETRDGRTVRLLEFCSRYGAPDRWRTVTWEVGTDRIARAHSVRPGSQEVQRDDARR